MTSPYTPTVIANFYKKKPVTNSGSCRTIQIGLAYAQNYSYCSMRFLLIRKPGNQQNSADPMLLISIICIISIKQTWMKY